MAISYTKLRDTFGRLSQNTTTENLDDGIQLMNFEQRYLLQKFFNNEGSYSMSTVGAQTLSTTSTILQNATSATLTVPWAYHSTTSNVGFSNGTSQMVQFSAGSTSISWAVPLVSNASTVLKVGGLQFYPMPPNYSKLKTFTITIGNLKWTPTEIMTREEWDNLNVFPYYADIPNNYFIYNDSQLGVWPIPSTTGNTISFNYKFRIPDLSIPDYSTGTISVANGSSNVTGSGTTFTITTNPQNETRWIQIPEPLGDNLWYQVSTVNSATSITLFQPYQGIAVSGGTYTLGQMPFLSEDFHDILLWRALVFYFTIKVDNEGKRREYQGLYDSKYKMLDEYSGSKTVHVNLGRRPNRYNPNLFPQSLS